MSVVGRVREWLRLHVFHRDHYWAIYNVQNEALWCRTHRHYLRETARPYALYRDAA